jgi:hypothetical protein
MQCVTKIDENFRVYRSYYADLSLTCSGILAEQRFQPKIHSCQLETTANPCLAGFPHDFVPDSIVWAIEPNFLTIRSEVSGTRSPLDLRRSNLR